MKINQLNELIGSVIPEINLTVDSVYPPKTGQGKKGVWHCQNLGCSDETGKIRVSVWNHSELDQTIKGTQIKIKSIAGKRGLSGVVCELNEWEKNGEVHKDVQLKVNDNGIIITQAGSVGSKSLEQPAVHPTDAPKPTFSAQDIQTRTGTPSQASKPTTTNPSVKLRKYGALYQACIDEASKIQIGSTKSMEDYRQIASCFFIQGIKDGIHHQMGDIVQTDAKSDLENDDINF